MTLTELFEQWMRVAPPPGPKTVSNYRSNFRQHIQPVLGEHLLTRVSHEDVAELLAAVTAKPRRTKGDGKATARQVHALVETIYKWRSLSESPPPQLSEPGERPRFETPETGPDVTRATAPRPGRRGRRTHSPDVSTHDPADGVRGSRIGEVAALRWQDLDLQGGWVHVRRALKEDGGRLYVGTPKSNDVRDVTLPSRVVAALRTQRELQTSFGPQGEIFTSPKGKQLWPSTFRGRDFRQACEAAGIDPLPTAPCAPVHGNIFGQGRIPRVLIQEALGHGSVAMTHHYIRLYQSGRSENRDRMDRLLGERDDPNVIPLYGGKIGN